MGVTIDPVHQKVYWTTGKFREVIKAKLDGSRVQPLVREYVALSTPYKNDIYLNRNEGTLYWGYLGDYISSLFTQADTSGAHRNSVNISSFGAHWLSSMVFDPVNDQLYMAVFTVPSPQYKPAIFRVDANNPETGDFEILLDENDLNSRVTGMGFDLETGKLYWTELGNNTIRRSNLDGTDIEDVLPDLESPSGITTDVENGKIYWTESDAGTISRANLDGTEIEVLFSNLSNPGRPHFIFENSGVPTSLPPVSRPVEFTLHQNHPNPFNPVTSIRYELPVNGYVSLEVYDIMGRKITILVDGIQPSGTHQVHWDGSAMASGVYIYRIQTGDFVQTRQMMLIK